MKVEKFKVLLYLKKSGLDKSGKAPIMGRITVNLTMAQFSSKLSCTPELWNPRESRLNGKSKEAVEINAKIEKLLLDINAVLDYTNVSRRWEMPARYYTQAFEEDGTTVRFVLVDTTPLMQKYRKDTRKYPDACRQDNEKQLAWVDSVLTSAKEDWIVVIGHHPIYAETSKDASERIDMQNTLDKVLRRHNNVALYACGHIHNFQHIRPKGCKFDYVVNSSASLSRKVGMTDGTVFCSPEPGFSVITANKKEFCLYMVDKSGKALHSVRVMK